MLVESVAVLGVLALLLISFMRTKHVGYAFAALPITIIPGVYLIASGLLHLSGDTLFGARSSIILLFCNVLSLAATCALLVFVSRRIHSKKNRRLYLGVMLLFELLLGWVYIYNSLQFIV